MCTRYVFESSGEKVPYDIPWASLQPDNWEGEDYIYFKYPDHKFYDGDAMLKAGLICEKV